MNAQTLRQCLRMMAACAGLCWLLLVLLLLLRTKHDKTSTRDGLSAKGGPKTADSKTTASVIARLTARGRRRAVKAKSARAAHDES